MVPYSGLESGSQLGSVLGLGLGFCLWSGLGLWLGLALDANAVQLQGSSIKATARHTARLVLGLGFRSCKYYTTKRCSGPQESGGKRSREGARECGIWFTCSG